MAFDRDRSRDEPDWARPIFGPVSWRSILERRSTIINDNLVEATDDPPASYTEVIYKGKFFPRGCRGKLEQLQIYCMRTAAGRLILRYSPHPCIGPIGEVWFTPGADWGWDSRDIEEMWDYDSLFIWVHRCDSDVSWGYDTELPYDGHEFTVLGVPNEDLGREWADMAIRPFIRAVLTCETPGDVPVSGIVNTIPIPNTATQFATGTVEDVASGALETICTGTGIGTLVEVRARFGTSVAPTAGGPAVAVRYLLNIYVDRDLAYSTDNRRICQSEVATSGRSSVGEFYQASVEEPAYDITRLAVRVPLQYRRSIRVVASQTTGGPVDIIVSIFANELR